MPKARTILVCGGAGYIGSHMCKRLAREGITPVAFDNLSTGHRWAVKWGPLVEGDLLDPAALRGAFAAHAIDGVMHFAARSLVPESMRDPGLYFRNNVTGTLNLLEAMREARVDRLVFSSTAAVYGNPEYTPIDEAHPTRPINPYGWSKLMAERCIEEHARAHGLRAASLRYFNAAGADPDGDIGEAHEPETHLIPTLLRSLAARPALPVSVHGDDYDTPDGTCVRDYVHVDDLCQAHWLALQRLEGAPGLRAFNLGSGRGTSVLDAIRAVERLLGVQCQVARAGRRAGDPPVLVASSLRARDELGWSGSATIERCIADAARWHARAPSAPARVNP
jgi:UDP-glucose-4-epimerase GalE